LGRRIRRRRRIRPGPDRTFEPGTCSCCRIPTESDSASQVIRQTEEQFEKEDEYRSQTQRHDSEEAIDVKPKAFDGRTQARDLGRAEALDNRAQAREIDSAEALDNRAQAREIDSAEALDNRAQARDIGSAEAFDSRTEARDIGSAEALDNRAQARDHRCAEAFHERTEAVDDAEAHNNCGAQACDDRTQAC